jgi:hypothetical protein
MVKEAPGNAKGKRISTTWKLTLQQTKNDDNNER